MLLLAFPFGTVVSSYAIVGRHKVLLLTLPFGAAVSSYTLGGRC